MKSVIEYINEAKIDIKLPYTFDIYNEGTKNVGYKITKKIFRNIWSSLYKTEEKTVTDERGYKYTTSKILDSYGQFYKLPLSAKNINYETIPDKESTDNWTKIPKIVTHTKGAGWYSDKWVEYNWNDFNDDWNKWLKQLKPYMKGKISVTIDYKGEKDYWKDKVLELTVNDETFNKEREEKIKELSDLNNLSKWEDNYNKREAERIKKRQEEEERKRKQEEEFNDWWNSLSDGEKTSWAMGYGRGNGNWTGD